MAKELAYLSDARFQRLNAFISEFTRRAKSEFTHKLKPADDKLIQQAEKDLASLGAQLEPTFHEQLNLLDVVDSKKAIHTKKNERVVR